MFIEKCFIALMAPLIVFFIYMLFAVIPVSLYSETKCLEKGYPKSKTTIMLKSYCINMEGAVTHKVIEL